MRRPVRNPSRGKFLSIPAPVNGLLLNRSVAAPDAASSEALENWFPTQRGIRVRGGMRRAAYVTNPVKRLFPYTDPTTPAFFAATDTAIYNVSGFDPVNAPAAAVSGRTSGYYSTQQIVTVGGNYLYAVNGADKPLLYNGATWVAIDGASTPAITGVTTTTLSHVWLYQSRLFFVQKNTMNAWFLPVDSIGGAAQSVSLSGIFQKGGTLLFGATWSLSTGNAIDDKCVFVSTEGEVAVYEGNDPTTAANWRRVGRYEIAKPLGKNATLRAGGDLLIATIDGIVPLSEVVQKDPAALSLAAVTRRIEPLWAAEANRATSPVELVKWTERALGLVIFPDSTVMPTTNLQTGAWAVQTGWNPTCGGVFLGKAYIGRADGRIMSIDDGGLDDGAAFTAKYCHAFNDFGTGSAYKRAQMIRCNFFADGRFEHSVAAAFDYTVSFPNAPAPANVQAPSGYLVWGVGLWGVGKWWSPSVASPKLGVVADWKSVSGQGYAMAPMVQITSGGATALNIELVRVDIEYEQGGLVV